VAHSGSIGPLLLAASGLQLQQAGRHLDQKTPVPQDVVHLAVGVAAGGQNDAQHRDLLQVFPEMTGAAREVGRRRGDGRGAGPMAGGLAGLRVGVWDRSALLFGSVLQRQGGGNRLVKNCRVPWGWWRESGAFSAAID
jgi:hypothetical protein